MGSTSEPPSGRIVTRVEWRRPTSANGGQTWGTAEHGSFSGAIARSMGPVVVRALGTVQLRDVQKISPPQSAKPRAKHYNHL